MSRLRDAMHRYHQQSASWWDVWQSALLDFPTVPTEQIEAILRDWEARDLHLDQQLAAIATRRSRRSTGDGLAQLPAAR
jgi:hypothetical protein